MLIVLAERIDTNVSAPLDHFHASTWYSPFNLGNNFVWVTITSEINPAQHTDCANYLFADGHCDMVTLEQFTQWVQIDTQNCLNGTPTNFAAPITQ